MRRVTAARTAFQSTLPARGATNQDNNDSINVSISIHAPRTGSDKTPPTPQGGSPIFQSTLPARGATSASLPRFPCTENFNPRSPHGERRHTANFSRSSSVFQSTLPARGATASFCGFIVYFVFQSTLPARGATASFCGFIVYFVFQSTLPARGATYLSPHHKTLKDISIHAPRTGSDDIQRGRCHRTATFQSTLPARGATISSADAAIGRQHFNPRSPHGERHRRPDVIQCTSYFNPRSPHGERRACVMRPRAR